MKHEKMQFVFTGVFALILFCSQASAAIIQFNDRTSFLNSTAATSATGALPDLGSVGLGPATVGSVTFTSGPAATTLFIGGMGSGAIGGDWTPHNPGNDIALSANEDLLVDFAGPVFSAGFDFVEPTDNTCYAPCFDTIFDVTLKSGGVVVDMFSFNAADDLLAFVGVWSDTSFDRLEIIDRTATNDDEYFGEFYTGTRSLSAVPLPAAVWLFGTALIGFIGLGKKTKST